MTHYFQLKDNTDNYAVLGNPISHSMSPKIHSLFADQLNHDIHYQAIEVPMGDFDTVVNAFFGQGGKGLNVTVPFKEEAFAISNELSGGAKLAGAVNTLSYDGKHIIGHNTDGLGLVYDLTQNHKLDLQGKDILVLGAGGAVRGVLAPLIDQAPSSITLANRTVSKAKALSELFSELFSIHSCSFEALEGQQYDLVINGTSASLNKKLPPLPNDLFKEDAASYDMMYSSEATLFQQWSSEKGVSEAFDGLGMLVEQAAEAFNIWRGVRPETSLVLKALRM